MKKIISILQAILIIAAMLHISVAKHYCEGNLVASNLSLSGNMAGCGMEGPENNCPPYNPGDNIKSHCCDDVITYFSIDNNYTPAINTGSGISPASFPVPDLSFISTSRFPDINSRLLSDISPPGLLMTSSVDLSDIRVLRL